MRRAVLPHESASSLVRCEKSTFPDFHLGRRYHRNFRERTQSNQTPKNDFSICVCPCTLLEARRPIRVPPLMMLFCLIGTRQNISETGTKTGTNGVRMCSEPHALAGKFWLDFGPERCNVFIEVRQPEKFPLPNGLGGVSGIEN